LRRTWRPFIWGNRYRQPQCDQPGQQRENTLRRTRRPPRPSLFGLAPGGACRAASVTSRAVRSYRTLSPLPRHAGAVCFLWRYPWGHPRRSLSGTLISWSPDFPPSRGSRPGTAAARPTGGPHVTAGAGGVNKEKGQPRGLAS